MKRTIVTLMALASIAVADTTYNVVSDVTAVTSGNSTASFTGEAFTSATVALTINVEAFGKNLGQTTGPGSNTSIVKFTGAWENADNVDNPGDTGTVGVVTWGDASSNGIESFYNKGTGSGNIHVGLQGCYTSNPIDWTNVEGMTMVMTMKPGATNADFMSYNIQISYLYNDGTVESVGAELNNKYRFGNSNAFFVSGLEVNAAYVDSYTVYSEYLTAADAKKLSVARVIPEPATATLSLMALCGLAARRRRK